jgi:hypothetical protein
MIIQRWRTQSNINIELPDRVLGRLVKLVEPQGSSVPAHTLTSLKRWWTRCLPHLRKQVNDISRRVSSGLPFGSLAIRLPTTANG